MFLWIVGASMTWHGLMVRFTPLTRLRQGWVAPPSGVDFHTAQRIVSPCRRAPYSSFRTNL